MPLVRIASIDDSRLDPFRKGMGDARLRDGEAGGVPLFLAESARAVERALDAGIVPHAMLLEEKWLDPLRDLVGRVLDAAPDVPAMVASPQQFAQVTGYSLTRGALTAMVRPPLPSARDVLRGARRVAVLEDVNNYANIGGIFRSAAALGIDAVLVTPSCHDPLFRRAARISRGAVFQVPWTRIGHERGWAEEGIPLLHGLGFQVAAMALHDESVTLDDPRLARIERLAVVLGAEGPGLSDETIRLADWTVLIPMMHGVDSLNVAAASAVAFWQLRAR